MMLFCRRVALALWLGSVCAAAQTPVAGIPHWREVSANVTRGGRPTAAAVQELARRGVRTILNLDDDESSASAEKQQVESLGMRFVAAPLSPFSYPEKKTVDGALAELRTAGNYPIFVHCEHGQDRTGLVVGLYRVFDDKWEPQAAYDEMLRLGFHRLLFGLDEYFHAETHLREEAQR